MILGVPLGSLNFFNPSVSESSSDVKEPSRSVSKQRHISPHPSGKRRHYQVVVTKLLHGTTFVLHITGLHFFVILSFFPSIREKVVYKLVCFFGIVAQGHRDRPISPYPPLHLLVLRLSLVLLLLLCHRSSRIIHDNHRVRNRL